MDAIEYRKSQPDIENVCKYNYVADHADDRTYVKAEIDYRHALNSAARYPRVINQIINRKTNQKLTNGLQIRDA
jgi:hypothetical protein